MKKNKFKKIIIMIIILLLISASLLILMMDKNKEDKNLSLAEIPVDYYNAYEKQIAQQGLNTNNIVASLENDPTKYYCIKDILDNFMTYVDYFTSNIDDLNLIIPEGQEQQALNEYKEEGLAVINQMLSENYKNKYSVTNEYIYSNLKNYAGKKYNVSSIYCVEESNYINTYYIYGKFDGSLEEYNFIVILDRYNSTFEIYLNNYLKDYNYNSSDIYSMKALNEKTIVANEYNTFSYKNVSKENIALEYYNEYIDKLQNNVQEAYDLLDSDYKNVRFKNLKHFEKYVKDNINTLKYLDITKYSIIDYDGYSEYICIDEVGNNYIFKQTSINNYTVLLDSYSTTVKTFEDEYNNLTNTTAKAQKCLNQFIEMINHDDYEVAYEHLNTEFRKQFNNIEGFKNYVKSNWPEYSYFYYDESSLSGENYIFSGQIGDILSVGSYNVPKTDKTFILKLDNTMKNFEISFNI